MSRLFLFFVGISGLTACVDETTLPGEPEDWALQEYVDEGELCATGGGTEPVVIQVDAGECLSSSCSRDFVGSCTATLEGSTITVTSDISWEQNVSPDASCTEDCGATVASCELPAVPDGVYTVVLGAESVELTAPSAVVCSPF